MSGNWSVGSVTASGLGQGRNRAVTYSPAYTLVPTYECFNRCTYCNFRTDPGQSDWMTLDQAEELLRSLPSGVIEILILSGEVHPQSDRRSAWFGRIYDLCQLALRLGFLPHTNVGPLSYDELAQLKTVNVSMGLMLEQFTDLPVHRHAPSKIPQLRLQQLQWAGELRIPFTTGLLLGIGETEDDWVNTLEAIAQVQQQWGHIQEVIVQPHSPGSMGAGSPFPMEKLVQAVAIARQMLPETITIQIPPNLVSSDDQLWACLEAGARDLGGIGPKDEVNPSYPHPQDDRLAQVLRQGGWQLQPRLPIYPQYDDWLAPALQRGVKDWRQRLPQILSQIKNGIG